MELKVKEREMKKRMTKLRTPLLTHCDRIYFFLFFSPLLITYRKIKGEKKIREVCCPRYSKNFTYALVT